jgi:uncharacterized protein YcfJ
MNELQIAGIVIGAVAGFFIGKFFQKRTGGVCLLLCNPKISTIYFALLGYLLTSSKGI